MFWIINLFFLGCNDSTLLKVIESKPEILVHPRELYFGHVESGKESETEVFFISNVGNSNLSVDQSLIDGSNRYYFPNIISGDLILEPGEILDVPIEYIPITYEHNGAVVKILSNDEENPEIYVSLEGFGDAPVIEVDPINVDYGNVSLGCDNEYRVTIENTGNLDLQIDSAIQMTTLPNDITIDYGSLPLPPWTLTPAEQIDLLIKYIPTDIGIDTSVVSINSNDPNNALIELTQSGTGDVAHWIIDEWVQEEEKIFDIIWVIDNSGSMFPFQNSLINNMSSFFTAFFAQQDVDFRMGFITTDDHMLVSGDYIDKNTADPISAATDILLSIGTYGSGNERGLLELNEAMSYFVSSVTFMREEANFVVIFLSDEQDNSANSYTWFISAYSLKKDPTKFKAYGVIGDYPSGCTGLFNGYPYAADYGAGYYELINYYGGDWFSICNPDWATSLTAIANDIIIRSVYPLSESDPVESTIEVYINSQLLTTGWIYDSSDNSVKFDANHIPTSGQTIRIEYATYGCGDLSQ